MKTIKTDENGYWHHNRCVSKCVYHIIFCPKFRRKVLTKPIRLRFKKLVREKQPEWNYKIVEMEVMPDHVHLLLQVDPEIGINNLVAKIKGYTASVLRQEFPELQSRLPNLWTRSRFIVSVGSVSLEIVKEYIENQNRS